MIRFEKVSFDQFAKDYMKATGRTDMDEIKAVYDSIRMPERSTSNAAGYDFFVPHECRVSCGTNGHIVTGIRAHMSPEWVLMLYPRSSLGIKRGITLANTTGIIDADYYEAENEGHIHIMLTTQSPVEQIITVGERVAQGIFVQYGIAENGNTDVKRIGGIGSTGK